MVSCKLERPRVSIIHVAPTRQGKSYTSDEVMKIFDEKFYLNLGSDFTMNSLSRYRHDLETGKCCFVNDATTLFASKSHRTKDRLVGGGGVLFDYLNCTCRTLSFACSADETVVNFDWYGFSVFHFENINWASVYADFVSGAFGVVNYYFYHLSYPLLNFIKGKTER